MPDGAPYSFYFFIEQKNAVGEWERLFNGGFSFTARTMVSAAAPDRRSHAH
jgi:hypothetical protein